MQKRSLVLTLILLFGAVGMMPTWAQSADTPQGLIAYTSVLDGVTQVYVMNADGSNPHAITTSESPDGHPSWSPDGTRIAFDSGEMGNNVFIIHADGTDSINMARFYAAHVSDSSQPAWSPDGLQIAFTAQDILSGQYGIYAIHIDGTGLIALVPGTLALNVQPAWSPDGSKIAFVSNRDGDPRDIYVMNADGSSPQRLTTNGGSDPQWSPDGTQIAYTAAFDIFVMNADGSDPMQLTQDATGNASPTWSPDGSQIAYVSHRDGNADIYVMNADGSGAHNLTHQPGDDLAPAWQPNAALSAAPEVTPEAAP